MLIVISPAKNLDYESPTPTRKHSKGALLAEAQELADQLKQMAPQDISRLMGVSDKLGTLNYDRYQHWQLPFTTRNARQAVFAFNGDVYAGLDAYSFNDDDLAFAQDRLRILSGLYGVLKPLDLMQPYRLEMGTKLNNPRGRDLYAFWGDKITGQLNKQLSKTESTTLLNLASNEYFKSVDSKTLKAKVVAPSFKDWKNGQYKMISFFAKKARGLMSAYIIKNQLTDVEAIKNFDWDGYRFSKKLSGEKDWVFTRRQ